AVAAIQAALQAGEPAGSPRVSHGRQTSGGARTGPGAEARGRTGAGRQTPFATSYWPLRSSAAAGAVRHRRQGADVPGLGQRLAALPRPGLRTLSRPGQEPGGWCPVTVAITGPW